MSWIPFAILARKAIQAYPSPAPPRMNTSHRQPNSAGDISGTGYGMKRKSRLSPFRKSLPWQHVGLGSVLSFPQGAAERE